MMFAVAEVSTNWGLVIILALLVVFIIGCLMTIPNIDLFKEVKPRDDRYEYRGPQPRSQRAVSEGVPGVPVGEGEFGDRSGE